MKKELSEKVFKKKIKLKKNDSTLIKDSSASGINSLLVAVHEINVDSIEVGFDFSYFNEIITQVDTIKIFRVDTLRITNIIEKGIPFYRSFWFGAAAVMVVMAVAGGLL